MDPFGDRFAQVLNGCLEFIFFDRVQPDDLLSAFNPSLRRCIRPYLEAASWLVSQKALCSPRINFVVNSKRRITDRIRFGWGFADHYIKTK